MASFSSEKLVVKQCTGRTLLDTMTLQNIKSSAIVKSSKLFLIHTSVPNYRRRRYKNRNKREKFLQLFFPHSWRIKPVTNEVSNTRRFGIELIPRTKKLLKNVHPCTFFSCEFSVENSTDFSPYGRPAHFHSLKKSRSFF